MKYCSKCGSPINDDAVFCAGCGTRVSDNNTNQNAENLQPTAEPEKVVQPTVEQTVNKEKPNVTNTVPIQQQSVYENIGTAEQKPKKKSKKVLFISIAVVLVLCITAGIIFVPSIFSGGAPKVVPTDENKALFDVTFEEFKAGIINNANKLNEKFSDVIDEKSQQTECIKSLSNEDNWTSWTNKDGNIVHKWTYKYDDDSSLSVDVSVIVDSKSNKIVGSAVTSYYPDTPIKTIVTSYLLFGNNLSDENFEILENLTLYCLNNYDDNPLLFLGNIGISMTEEDYDVTYTYLPLSKKMKEEYSSNGVWISPENLYRFDKVLSARYGIEYEWKTLDEFIKSLGA